MRTITLKGIPDDLYRRLKQSARTHHRSLNREVMAQLEGALGSRRVDAADLLARVDAVRERQQLPYLTDRALRAAKSAGRA